jgi:hypothetical protein
MIDQPNPRDWIRRNRKKKEEKLMKLLVAGAADAVGGPEN